MGNDFPTVDLSDENKARGIWIDGYFYNIKDFLMKNLNVIDAKNYNKNFDLRMSVSGFQPNLGYKSFELQIENRNDNSLFKTKISEQENIVEILGSGTTGEMKVLFFSDKYSIECFLEVCQTVAKNFLNFKFFYKFRIIMKNSFLSLIFDK
jgi:hypothetical protein